MKTLIVLITCLSLSFTSIAHERNSFRLTNGKLIKLGKTKSDILMLVGAPLFHETEQFSVDIGQDSEPKKREIFTYKLDGSIAGKHIVVITFENNQVISISSKQANR